MNKRILISVIMLLIAAILSVTSFAILHARFSALSDALENALYAGVTPDDSCAQIGYAWNRCARVSQFFLLHSDLCELRTALESLPDLTQEPTLYKAACVRGLHLLEGICDSLAPTPENIL